MKKHLIFLGLLVTYSCKLTSQSWDLNFDWVNFLVAQDARIIYLSTTGDDATAQVYDKNHPNVGLDIYHPPGAIKPYATLQAAKSQLRKGYPDILLLRRGDVFENQSFGVVELYGRNQNERLQIGAYGTGERPKVLTGDQNFISFAGASASFVAISDIYAEPHTRTGFDEPIGLNLTTAPFKHFYISNCHFHLFHTHLVVQDNIASGPITRSRFVAFRNIFTNAYKRGGSSGGLYFARIDSITINGNLIHHNGWNEAYADAMPNGFSHNTYFHPSCKNLVFHSNIVSQASAVGGGFRCGGHIESNVFLSNPTGMLIGSYDQGQINWPNESVSADVIYNAVLNPRPEGFDTGHGLVLQRTENINIENNLIAHAYRPNVGANAIAIDRAGRVFLRNNTIYNWTTNAPATAGMATALLIGGNILDSIIYTENTVLQTNAFGRCAAKSGDFSHLHFSKNHWYSGLPSDQWFQPSGSYDNWSLACGEEQSNTNLFWLNDPYRDAASYMESLGRPASEEAFIDARIAQDRYHWNDTITAPFLLDYLFGGLSQLSGLGEFQLPSDSHLQVWPNPVSSQCTLNGVEKNSPVIATNAVTGQEATLIPINNQLDFSELSSGFYWLQSGKKQCRVLKL